MPIICIIVWAKKVDKTDNVSRYGVVKVVNVSRVRVKIHFIKDNNSKPFWYIYHLTSFYL